MPPRTPIRPLRLLLVALPLTLAFAQGGPPPPPAPLGPPPVPPANLVTPAKTLLGMALFWDEQLSSTRTVACGSCHQGGSGGSDPRSVRGGARAAHPGPDGALGTSDDITGSPGVPLASPAGDYEHATLFGMREQVTPRLSPSHINAAYAPSLFWDGRAAGVFTDPVTQQVVIPAGGALETQSLGPPLSDAEMAHRSRTWDDVVARLQSVQPLALAAFVPADLDAWIAGRGYPALFAEAFGSPGVTARRIALAIATYERTLFSNQSPLDSLAANPAALTPQEAAGRALFATLPCGVCHGGPLLTDQRFHYIGVRPAGEDSGRAKVTLAAADLGAMRTPSLRNVALRKAFMHDGRFSTLEEVVDFYARGGDFNAPNRSPLIAPLNLTPIQRQQLVAFMSRPLTDPRVAAESAPFHRPSLYSESELVPQVGGSGVAGAGGAVPQPVAYEPPITGNPAFTVAVTGGASGAAAVFVADDADPAASPGIPPSGSLARVATTLAAAGAGAGSGSVTFAIPADPALEGRTFLARWFVTDPAASGGVAISPLVTFRVFGARGAGVLDAGGSAPLTTPRALRLFAAQPNPFRPGGTQLRFELYAPSSVRLVIHDAAGREVRRLLDSAFELAGMHSVRWDGRDDHGRAAPAGVYFYSIRAGSNVETMRTIKLD